MIEQEKRRVNFYIDGLNVYWRLKDYFRSTGENYQWLDYFKLCTSLLKENEDVGKVYLFTTKLRDVDEEASLRYENFKKAQEASGVKVLEGYLNRTKQEKETDLKIGTQILLDAIYGDFHTALLMSTDNDFAVTFRAIKQLVKDKKIEPKVLGLITPPYDGIHVQLPWHNKLRQECTQVSNKASGKLERLVKRLKFEDLKGFSLPLSKLDTNGELIFKMPEVYQQF